MSYHTVIEPIWCQGNRYLFPPPWAWPSLTMAKVRLSLSICFWVVQECEMAFCACLGSTVQPTGTVQGCCPWLLPENQAFPGGAMVLGAAGAAPHLSPELWLRAYPPNPSLKCLMHFSTFLIHSDTHTFASCEFFPAQCCCCGESSQCCCCAAVSQSRPNFTCAQVQHFPFPLLARPWQLPKPILWTFAQIS